MARTHLLLVLLLLQASVSAQTSALKGEQLQAVNKIISTFRTKDKSRIAALVRYPLKRQYPLKDINNRTEMLKRFDEVFDAGFVNYVANSKPGDWPEMGWRGIMFENGSMWLEDEKTITAVNHQSPAEQKLLEAAILADKATLPAALRKFEKPVYLIITKHYRIRIDELNDGTYRYASWKPGARKAGPELVLESDGGDSGGTMTGSHAFVFKNGIYTYEVSIGDKTAAGATISVLKSGQLLLNEDGKVIRK